MGAGEMLATQEAAGFRACLDTLEALLICEKQVPFSHQKDVKGGPRSQTLLVTEDVALLDWEGT